MKRFKILSMCACVAMLPGTLCLTNSFLNGKIQTINEDLQQQALLADDEEVESGSVKEDQTSSLNTIFVKTVEVDASHVLSNHNQSNPVAPAGTVTLGLYKEYYSDNINFKYVWHISSVSEDFSLESTGIYSIKDSYTDGSETYPITCVDRGAFTKKFDGTLKITSNITELKDECLQYPNKRHWF